MYLIMLGYRTSLHINHIFEVLKKMALKQGVQLIVYAKYNYSGSQLSAIHDFWAKIMGATYMRVSECNLYVKIYSIFE